MENRESATNQEPPNSVTIIIQLSKREKVMKSIISTFRKIIHPSSRINLLPQEEEIIKYLRNTLESRTKKRIRIYHNILQQAKENYRHHFTLTWMIAAIIFPLSLGLFGTALREYGKLGVFTIAILGFISIFLLMTWYVLYVRWGVGIDISQLIAMRCEYLLGKPYIATRIFYDLRIRKNWFESRSAIVDVNDTWLLIIGGAVGLWITLLIRRFIELVPPLGPLNYPWVPIICTLAQILSIIVIGYVAYYYLWSRCNHFSLNIHLMANELNKDLTLLEDFDEEARDHPG